MKSCFFAPRGFGQSLRKALCAAATHTIASTLLTFCLFLSSAVSAADSSNSFGALLPTSDQPAEKIPHFPNRTAAFVWRNWNLAPIDALARTLDADTDKIRAYADEMGLPPYEAPTWESEQIYITLLRRNWSILPFDQLLKLLDLKPDELAKKLREDDFLSVKLGAKPFCEPLRFEEPTDDVVAALRRFADDVAPCKAIVDRVDVEPRFAFLRDFDGGNEGAPKLDSDKPSRFEICYLHSYFAVFGDPLLQDDRKLYPDGLLAQLSDRGVNGVWLHALLRDVAPPCKDFPEFGEQSEIRRETLRRLVARAKRYGIDVYLYMNEPRAMPLDFFKERRETQGVVEGEYAAMCASCPLVRQWLSDALAGLFADVPGLGGIFTISGSENLTTCVSHGRFADCPRCSQFTDAELIADLNAAMAEGVWRSAPEAKVIVWDWGWRGHGLAEDVIEKLPKDAWFQSVSEWALPITRGGVSTTVGEYSISAVGPGARATAHWAAAKRAGLKTIAKCQFNTTWEIGSIPAVPALDLVARHAWNLSRANVDGVMAGWSLGGFPSMNLEAVAAFARDPDATPDGVLDALAARHYGDGASLAREGWRLISDAFEEFPYGGSVVYMAPNQIGPANLLRLEATGWRASMVGIPYDDLDSWRGPYPPETFADQMEKCGDGFLVGAERLKKAAAVAPDGKRKETSRQAGWAEFAGLVFKSVANQTRFILIRDERARLLNAASSNERDARLEELEDRMIELARAESTLATKALEASLKDSRIGFESTNQYWFVPNDLVEKTASCAEIIRSLENAKIERGRR